MLLVLAIPYGLGAGAIDAALNNYVALYYSAKHMSWLHCFWGVGTIVSPFVMSRALAHSTWNSGYLTVGLIQTGIGLVLLATLSVWNVNRTKTGEAHTHAAVGLRDVLKIKGVPYLLLGFFAYCAAEATAMQWASCYFVEVKKMSAETAAAFASLFYIGLTTGRFLGGFMMDKLGDRKMILIGTSILLCGIVSLYLPVGTDFPALAGFVIIGFGCAPIYPLHHPFHPGKFRSEILRCDYRNSNGERLHRSNLCPAALRTARQSTRLPDPADLPFCFCDFDNLHGRKDLSNHRCARERRTTLLPAPIKK